VIDKNQYTQRMDFVQSSASTWMGRYSYGTEHETAPALKLNGTKLTTNVHQVMLGNTRTLSSNVVNEFRFGYNYFFNTFGRELAFVRNVVKELGIPGLNADFRLMVYGEPVGQHDRFSGFGDSTEGHTRTEQGHGVHRQRVVAQGETFLKVGEASARPFQTSGYQFARGKFFQLFEQHATGYSFATSCSTTRSSPKSGGISRDEIARRVRRTTSPTPGRSVRT